MRIIISPAKKMNQNPDILEVKGTPVFIKDAEVLLERVRKLDFAEAKKLWKCNEQIAILNYERFQNMDLDRNLTPAVLSYEGLQYQYMAPTVMEQKALDYIEAHLRILSGFYGVLRPFDGIVPYRLEMQAKFQDEPKSLYDFWGERIAAEVCREATWVLNLASEEYGKCVRAHCPKEVNFVDVVFGEVTDGKLKEKGTYAKMARGEMVRFLAEHQIENIEEIKGFDRLGFAYAEEYSGERCIAFVRKKQG